MDKREEYYARVKKITGTHLFEKIIGVFNAPFTSKAIELLATCGVVKIGFYGKTDIGDFFANVWKMDSGAEFEHEFVNVLKSHNQFEDRWEFLFDTEEKEDILLAGGTWEICVNAYKHAREKNIPAILSLLFANGTSVISVVVPGDPFPFTGSEKERIVEVSADQYFDWIDLNNQMANIAKAILLEGTEWQRNDIMAKINGQERMLLMAHPTWPWVSRYINISNDTDFKWLRQITSLGANGSIVPKGFFKKTVLVVGLGSLGSVTAEHFMTLGCSIVGIDGKDVSIYNPSRQQFSTADIGESKAFALARSLAFRKKISVENYDEERLTLLAEGKSYVGIKKDIHDSREGSKLFAEIIEEYNPDLVVLATAHPAEYRMADECRKKNIPHIVCRCYARARWYEITCVNGNRGPCFGCMQGHLYKGAPPSLTEEELAVYERSGDEANKVQAEPATRVDTSRCADFVARLGLQFMLDDAQRASWFLQMLSEERTCLIGGNYCEYHEENHEWSYGVSVPGGVSLYGVINFIGSETENEKTCIYCGKTHEVLIKRKALNVA
jgi:molybdopterin/thiamine biosynthesis adenylyltransferase